MGAGKTILKVVGVGVGVLALAGGGFLAWAKSTSDAKLAATWEVPDHTFPIPFPLSEAEVAELRAAKAAEAVPAEGVDLASATPPADPLAGVDLDAIALERAVARGKHLVEARYGCQICHGGDFGGGVMVDDPMVGSLRGPNLTTGKGSKTLDYDAADWSRAVRHGVSPAGTGLVMPADDFVAMADRELSDIVAFIRTLPPVDREVEASAFGPLGWVLHATDSFVLAAAVQKDVHGREHAAEPPPEGVTVEFGEHVAKICTGCHGTTFAGGPIAGAPPDWPAAMNITPDASGLAGMSYEDFRKVLTSGVRLDGSPLRKPMSEMLPAMAHVTDTEMRALWTYLSQVPPVANEY